MATDARIGCTQQPRGVVELELGAAAVIALAKPFIYNQQLHADQSANAIAGDVVKRGRRADGRCGPHSLELSASASQCAPDVCARLHMRVCSIRIQPKQQTYSRPLELGQRTGNRNFQRHVLFRLWPAASAAVRAVDADGRYR